MDTNYEQTSLLDEQVTKAQRPVECLGLTFESDEARRSYFLEILREKLRDSEFRKIEGFPRGDDEDILALSDPPYYTACPNPFIEDFIKQYSKTYDQNIPYRREPFAVDVSEGKADPIYNAHYYHTKVPYKAIMRAILHYTEPDDVILDGFGGSGMTGVAGQMCDEPDPEFKLKIEDEWRSMGWELPRWGLRRVILNDIGPAATFIAANYNQPYDIAAFEHEAKRILKETEQELGWLYETLHSDGKTSGRINYIVWSEVFSCPECSEEVSFWDEALDIATKHVKAEFPCPHCGTLLTKSKMDRLYETYIDTALGQSIKRPKRRPALINYSVGKKTFEKRIDDQDLARIKRIEELPFPMMIPTDEIPFMHMTHQRAHMAAFGVTHIHHFYLPGTIQVIGTLWAKAKQLKDIRLRNILLFWLDSHLGDSRK